MRQNYVMHKVTLIKAVLIVNSQLPAQLCLLYLHERQYGKQCAVEFKKQKVNCLQLLFTLSCLTISINNGLNYPNH